MSTHAIYTAAHCRLRSRRKTLPNLASLSHSAAKIWPKLPNFVQILCKCANRSIFREVITFRIFSKWLPSAILNFEKFKFWTNLRGRSRNLRRQTKFGQNRMIGGRYIAIKRNQIRPPPQCWIYFRFIFWHIFKIRKTKCVRIPNFVQIGFRKIQILDKFSRAESKSASAHQIWSKSDDRLPRYCDKNRNPIWPPPPCWIYFRLIFWHIFKIRTTKCVCIPNFMQIGPYLAKL